jgi:hypothetical protein
MIVLNQALAVVNGPHFSGKVLQLYKGQMKGVQLDRYQLNDMAQAGHSADKYLSVAISICSFPGRMTISSASITPFLPAAHNTGEELWQQHPGGPVSKDHPPHYDRNKIMVDRLTKLCL